MKKIFIFASLFVALSCFSSCVESFEKEESSKITTIECVTPSDTKMYIDGVSVKWNENDIIYAVPTADKSQKRTYKLKTGAGSTNATFEVVSPDSSFVKDTPVWLFTKTLPGGDFIYSSDKHWYFDIPDTQTLAGYSSVSDENSLPIPMTAQGVIGEQFAFQHVASLVRLKVKNEYSTDITIKEIVLSSNTCELGGRFHFEPSNPSSITSLWRKAISATGSVEIAAGATKYFDFIIGAGTYTGFSANIILDNDVKYVFTKSSHVANLGDLNSFETKINDSYKEKAIYKVSVDGDPAVDFFISKGFPKTPTTSVKIISLSSETITSTDWEALVALINTIPDPVTLDFTEMTVFGTAFNKTLSSSKVTDFYLPSNVTKITGYGHFATSPNLKLHITKAITYIDWVQFCTTLGTINNLAGFYVDSDNANYSSENGILYSKSGETIESLPCYNISDIVIKEGVKGLGTYAVSNNAVATTITLPSTIKAIGSYNFMAMKNLHTIFIKAANPPTISSVLDGSGSGKVVIDTGVSAATDSISKLAYIDAWSSKLGSWQVVTKAEYIPPTKSAYGSISDFNKNGSYSSTLW